MKIADLDRAKVLRDRLSRMDSARFQLHWGRDKIGMPEVSIHQPLSGDRTRNILLSDVQFDVETIDRWLVEECIRLTNLLRGLGVDDVPDVLATASEISRARRGE